MYFAICKLSGSFQYIYDFQYLQMGKEEAAKREEEGKDPLPLFALNVSILHKHTPLS